MFSIFIFSIFEIFDNNFSNNALFKYIKSGLLDLDDEEIFLIENFRWKMVYQNINGKLIL